MMKFINFTAMTESGLTKKVNRFLEENPYIEVIKFDYTMGSRVDKASVYCIRTENLSK